MSAADLIPDRLADMPLSVPAWVAVLYGAILVSLGWMSGSVDGLACVILAAIFSFQFWTFAAWRGLCRRRNAGAK